MLVNRIDSRSPSVLPHRVSIPSRLIKGEIGAGTLVRKLTTRLRLPTCAGCQDRADALNRGIVFVGAGKSPAPKPGCWFAGTSCYGFIQTLKFCCGDGTEYTERYGWCIGFWFAPPCYPLRPGGQAPRMVNAASRGGILGRRARTAATAHLID
jgi:hypothetical protein